MERRHLLLASPAVLLAAGGCGVSIRRGGETGRSGAPPASDEDRVPRIDVDAAHAEVQAGRAVLVDVRTLESYQRSRAAGAILLPLDQLEASIGAARVLPDGKRPVLYCT
jgi:hypothetical protein